MIFLKRFKINQTSELKGVDIQLKKKKQPIISRFYYLG